MILYCLLFLSFLHCLFVVLLCLYTRLLIYHFCCLSDVLIFIFSIFFLLFLFLYSSFHSQFLRYLCTPFYCPFHSCLLFRLTTIFPSKQRYVEGRQEYEEYTYSMALKQILIGTELSDRVLLVWRVTSLRYHFRS
jgi:hypothetical protein